ncbi:predicted protein [Lichtheimia corymbifera JMRC:FSU:9682]|uniref:Uncharacterized protein n=1 Tax=Lichtheimia corymbifera JMRC:FSU:9682 TaxID=1263082 RepID=A0A068RTC9_9FUNG|nr:predicted protein [Lichtheimia corymbifera JMRC:FSU:9682]
MGGLSADLYSFDCKCSFSLSTIISLPNHTITGVITGYLLIKQFKRDKAKSNENDQMISKTMQSDIGSTLSRNSRDEHVRELQGLEALSMARCRNCTNLIYPDTEIININHASKS